MVKKVINPVNIAPLNKPAFAFKNLKLIIIK
jgi:hypothetical protein